MANFNKVTLLGNLTRDIEVRHTQGGLAIAKFGMAINRKSKSQDGEMRETTCFVDLTAFGKQAEILEQYVSRGSPLFVDGRLEYSTWEDKNGGGKRSKLEVIVENFQFLGGGQQGGKSGSRKSGGSAGTDGASENVDYDDIPF